MKKIDSDINEIDLIKQLLSKWTVRYIIVHTKFTIHHIEKLSATCRDRGNFKWVAESKGSIYDTMEDEGKRSHIDSCDMFPRAYFSLDSLVNEIFAWMLARNLKITSVVSGTESC